MNGSTTPEPSTNISEKMQALEGEDVEEVHYNLLFTQINTLRDNFRPALKHSRRIDVAYEH